MGRHQALAGDKRRTPRCDPRRNSSEFSFATGSKEKISAAMTELEELG